MGLRDFMGKGLGQVAMPAAGAAIGAMGGAPAGNMFMQGLQMVVQQEANQQLASGLRDAMGPIEPPIASDAQSASRQSPNSEIISQQRRVIDTMLANGDVQGALTMYKGLNDMMTEQNKPIQVSAGNSMYTPGQGFEQAPGTFGISGNTIYNNVTGQHATTPFGEGELANSAALNEARASEFASAAAANTARAGYYNVSAKLEAIKAGRAQSPMEVMEAYEFLGSAEGQALAESSPQQFFQLKAYVDHYMKQWAEAEGVNIANPNPSPDDSREGVSALNENQGKLRKNPDGSYSYVPE